MGTLDERTHPYSVSLCMIVRNEEQKLARTIHSVCDIVNEIIVVDTGSTDKTRECAEALGATVHTFQWQDDFSAARNFSLRKAHSEWILVLDADEVIAKGDLHRIVEKVRDDDCDAVVLTQRNYCNSPEAEGWCTNKHEYKEATGYEGYFDIPIIRLFRNDPSIYYEGLIHEVVDRAIVGKRKRYADVIIHHYPQFEQVEERAKKSQYYLTLLKKQLERNPEDANTWFLLGRQYYTLGRWAETIVFLKRVIDHGSKCEMAYDNLAAAYVNVQLFEEAHDVLQKILHLNPRYSEAFVTLGVVYYEMGEKVKAIEMLGRAIELRPASFKPYFNLAALYYREKNFSDAYSYIKKAEEHAPHFARVLYLKFFICCECQLWQEAHRSAEALQHVNSLLYEKIVNKHRELHHTYMIEQGVSPS